jgi:hypothetical protein
MCTSLPRRVTLMIEAVAALRMHFTADAPY